MPRKLEGTVIVITGASSGIGRATAIMLAGEGANLVLAARHEDALGDVVRNVEALGRRAVAVPTDVSDELSVMALANVAMETFDHVDVWINNAGVSVIGQFHEVPMQDMRRVFETDVFGVMYGSREALAIFRRQHRGTLINVASMVAEVPQPYAAAYVSAKAAVRGLSAALRQELVLQRQRDIHVVTVMPAVIDTPFFVSAANYTGQQVQPPPPVNHPEVVAQAMLKAIRKPTREIYVGRPASMLVRQMRVLPAITERSMAKMIDRFHLADERSDETTGNLYSSPSGPRTIEGGWGSTKPKRSRWTRVLGASSLGLLVVILRRRGQI
jgi:short-subunit dehydrogenase